MIKVFVLFSRMTKGFSGCHYGTINHIDVWEMGIVSRSLMYYQWDLSDT